MSLRIWEELGAAARDPESALPVGADTLFFKPVGAISKTDHSVVARSLRINIRFPNVAPYNYYEWQNILLVAGVELLHIVATYAFCSEIVVFEKCYNRDLFFLCEIVLMV